MTTIAALLASVKDAIITVGAGRGFVVAQDPWPHRVITAAHCLPGLPPANAVSYFYERTYASLLGPLAALPTLSTECLFVDPIADLAVLCEPDNQTLTVENQAYESFMDGRPTLRLGTVEQACDAWLLTETGEWERCSVRVGHGGRVLTLVGAGAGNGPGTSGSPILTSDGRAVGIVSIGSESSGRGHAEQHGQPRLASGLPGWLLAELLDQKGGA